jgi:3-deoxy-manno-octulosonate cytidylyltransferase (CMP-KDO synthetase)
MKIIGIIPARMASSRFPGKPLARILGIPMLGHVYFRSKMSRALDDVYAATCDKEIIEYMESIDGKAIMTSDKHERASDRTTEAVLKIEKENGQKVDIIVMIQGDEPMVIPNMIELAVQPIREQKDISVVNLMSPIMTAQEYEDPNTIKVVVDQNNYALYFSREPIPSRKKGATGIPMFKQVCIIPFRRSFLIKYSRLEPTPLEKIESIDMLRVLEYGYKVKMVLSDFQTHSVDTPDDLRLVEGLMKNDPLFLKYAKNKR